MAQARGVAVLGDSENIGTWSGIPYHLLHAGLKVGFLARGLDLRVPSFKTSRGFWQIQRVLCAERPRGFQYCSSFLDSLGERALEECSRKGLKEIISHYQVLPASDLARKSIATSYYIDSTLHDLFETSGMLSWLNRKTVREAINRETENYRVAERIVAMSLSARTTLTGSYGIAEDRIFTVLPGANLPEDEVKIKLGDVNSSSVPDEFTQDRKLRIGFTGKDWRRKGLHRLVVAVEALNRMGIPSEVVAIGHIPSQYQRHPNVRALGFINKSTEMSRFINIVAGCDLGCAPSHEEPLGIAPLEYLRLGVPVICTATGGLTDVCRAAGPASVILEKDATSEEIAFAFEALASNPDRLRQMRTAAWERKEYFSWDRTVRELQCIWKPGFRTEPECHSAGHTNLMNI